MDARRLPNQELDISPEETKWVKDCISSKTYTHVVPMALGSLIAMKFASMKGYHLGMLARAGVVCSSLVLGRLASIPSCLDAAEAQFPDGTIVAARRGNREQRQPREVAFAPDSPEQMPITDYNASKVPQSSPQQSSQFAPSASQQTYDDLRRRNRDQYTSRRTAPAAPSPADASRELYPPPQSQRPDDAPYDSQYSPPISSSYSDPPSPYAESTPLISSIQSDDDVPSKVRRRKRVNIYGDEIED
ncbi:uncharacterized protein LOC117653840 [Thrips palmi]|uniref:Uncharacterized protein LOC117653840 n=1 Tax=Thrips palmi TaxID=161013 RepID=A0A6P9AJN1_THRPL|nr:uncharacterized protein LOC117653840 [Thrips palmi]XP_034255681.1 uncharacterized protein LOC117653840 [Thrips palmi]